MDVGEPNLKPVFHRQIEQLKKITARNILIPDGHLSSNYSRPKFQAAAAAWQVLRRDG